MPKLAANLSFLFPELPFPDRFRAASEAGFSGVEFLFPYDYPAREIASCLRDTGLEQVLFNAPPGNWDGGERGIAALPGREQDFRDGFLKALEYASELSCSRIHVMAGLLPDGANKAHHLGILRQNLAWAATKARTSGVTILLEPLNAHDMPGYLYSRTGEVVEVIGSLGFPNVKLQLDLYHRQMTEGRLTAAIEEHLPLIGHIQIAGVPGRNEPGPSELNPAYLFNRLDEMDYDGWIGCEYHPGKDTLSGLSWADQWLTPILGIKGK